VISLATAAKLFGLNGTLVRGMSEASAYSDNVFLFRVGAAQGTFAVGSTSPDVGTTNLIHSASSLGGLITYSLGAIAPSGDVTIGAPVSITGFANTEFNSPGNPGGNTYIVSFVGSTYFQVQAPSGTVADATEGVYADNYARSTDFSVLTTCTFASSGGVATVHYVGAPPIGIVAGDIVTTDSLAGTPSPDASADGLFTVVSKSAHDLVMTPIDFVLVPFATSTLSGGTLTAGAITMTVSCTNTATLSYAAAQPAYAPAGLKAGDKVVLASLADAAADIAADWDNTYTVTSNIGSSLVLSKTGLTNGGPKTLIAGTLSSYAQNNGHLIIPAQDGYNVTLGQVDATDNVRYKIWFKTGGGTAPSLLSIWLDNNLVYSNDPSYTVNTGDCEVLGSTTGGTDVGDPAADILANAVTIAAAGGLITYVAPQTGIGLTARQLYIAIQNAMNLLQGFPIDEVYLPGSLLGNVGALADNPNVAFYVPETPSTLVNNPAVNIQALDWLWTGIDVDGNPIYQWASENKFWLWNNQPAATYTLQGQGSPTTPIVEVFTDPTTRLAAGVGSGNLQPEGFHEVNFAYQLARFCAAQSEAPQADNGGCLGFIGTSGPASLSDFSLPAVKRWIGYLPVYDPTSGGATVSGAGLLGIPFLVGCSIDSLNDACAEQGVASFRVPGLFSSVSGEYDGGPEIDANGYKIDDGAYIAVQGDYALQSNGYGTYVGNIAGLVAGLVSSLDQLNSVTNKQVASVSQLYRASLNQLDALTFADVDMLRFKGTGALPVCLHDKTAATTASDYTLMLRQRIKFLVIQTLLAEANNYIGKGTNDGLTLTALKTALDADCSNLQKRGYLSSYNFTITSTKAQQKIGQASIQISFVPANELVQLNATIGINLNG
jgi:hypothetical protein